MTYCYDSHYPDQAQTCSVSTKAATLEMFTDQITCLYYIYVCVRVERHVERGSAVDVGRQGRQCERSRKSFPAAHDCQVVWVT